ncbi:MAG TPA: AAA family ATPase [Oscillospiraceae bacterium]|nr:AAA family ATPase [Oscillospiraceae bacterium]HPF56677.1 AAA family ATPase [Clostridiales bacterium]HPK36556.1 AAA family ATPase [Oscillospiraceae bacterium]HPR76638.1 AAA family ATPase [Oscillospiraceae bacterium]
MKKPFVIAISGVSGSGKTTVTKELESRLKNYTVLSFDDYDDVYLAGREINDLPEGRNLYDDWQVGPIAADIEQLLREPLDYIIMDYPFGRQNSAIAPYIDLSVFVDVPLDAALARRIIRDYTDRGSERHEISVDLKALGDYLKHYLNYQIPTYRHFIDTQKPYADVVIDGMQNVKTSADQIVEYLSKKE